MRVIVEKAFGIYSVGAVIPEMPENQAGVLIARGLVREDKLGERKQKGMRSPVNRMIATAPESKELL